MGSITDQGVRAGDWKGGHIRIDSNEREPTGSSDSVKGDDIELHNPDKALDGGAGQRQFPDALNDQDQSSGDEPAGEGTFQFYKVYKRRWFGLVQLTLLNIIVSWDVSIQYLLLAVPLSLFSLCEPAIVVTPPVRFDKYSHGRALL